MPDIEAGFDWESNLDLPEITTTSTLLTHYLPATEPEFDWEIPLASTFLPRAARRMAVPISDLSDSEDEYADLVFTTPETVTQTSTVTLATILENSGTPITEISKIVTSVNSLETFANSNLLSDKTFCRNWPQTPAECIYPNLHSEVAKHQNSFVFLALSYQSLDLFTTNLDIFFQDYKTNYLIFYDKFYDAYNFCSLTEACLAAVHMQLKNLWHWVPIKKLVHFPVSLDARDKVLVKYFV